MNLCSTSSKPNWPTPCFRSPPRKDSRLAPVSGERKFQGANIMTHSCERKTVAWVPVPTGAVVSKEGFPTGKTSTSGEKIPIEMKLLRPRFIDRCIGIEGSGSNPPQPFLKPNRPRSMMVRRGLWRLGVVMIPALFLVQSQLLRRWLLS